MAYFDQDGKPVKTPEAADNSRPAVTTSTDEWLARISDQLQVLVDAVQSVREEGPSDEESDEPAGDDSGADDQGGQAPQGDGTDAQGKDDKSATAKKTAAKRAEVRGQ